MIQLELVVMVTDGMKVIYEFGEVDMAFKDKFFQRPGLVDGSGHQVHDDSF